MEPFHDNHRVGVCLDTCHIFAAGYDISTSDAYEKTMERFDRLIGISRLHLIHVNDCKKPCGSRVDRHAHIRGRVDRSRGVFLPRKRRETGGNSKDPRDPEGKGSNGCGQEKPRPPEKTLQACMIEKCFSLTETIGKAEKGGHLKQSNIQR